MDAAKIVEGQGWASKPSDGRHFHKLVPIEVQQSRDACLRASSLEYNGMPSARCIFRQVKNNNDTQVRGNVVRFSEAGVDASTGGAEHAFTPKCFFSHDSKTDYDVGWFCTSCANPVHTAYGWNEAPGMAGE